MAATGTKQRARSKRTASPTHQGLRPQDRPGACFRARGRCREHAQVDQDDGELRLHTTDDVLERVKDAGDLFADVLRLEQALPR